MELVNAWIARGEEVYGDDFLARMNVAVARPARHRLPAT